jgi:hypothetical protein
LILERLRDQQQKIANAIAALEALGPDAIKAYSSAGDLVAAVQGATAPASAPPGSASLSGGAERGKPRRSDITARPMAARAESAVRRALIAGHNRPKTIREASGLERWQVAEALRALEKAGAIEGEGITRARVYRLL